MRPASVLIKRKRSSVELRDTSSRGDAWLRFESTSGRTRVC